MRLGILFLFLTLTISGCTSYSGPKNNAEFGYINKPSDLAGIYKNKGEPVDYLSRYVFKSKKGFDQDIQYIQVEVSGDTLQVGAVQKGCIIYSEKYLHGNDFEISNGRIKIESDFSFLPDSAGGTLVGPRQKTIYVGLDIKNNGKVSSNNTGGGLVYMVMPIVFSHKSEIRFERVDRQKLFKKCR